MEVMIKEGAEKRLNDASGRGAVGDAATLSEIRKFCVRSAAKNAGLGFFCYLRERHPAARYLSAAN